MYIPKATHKGSVLLVLLDVAVVACAPFLASVIRFFHTGDPFHGVFKHPYGFIVAGLIYLLLLFISDLHNSSREYRSIPSFIEMGLVVTAGFMFSIFLFYSFTEVSLKSVFYVGRGVFGLNAVWVFVLGYAGRCVYSARSSRTFFRVAVLGESPQEQFIKEYLEEHPEAGVEITGTISVEETKEGSRKETDAYGIKSLGTLDDMDKTIEENKINLIIVAAEDMTPDLYKKLLNLGMMNVDVIDMPSFYENLTGKVPFDHIDHEWLLTSLIKTPKFYVRNIKPKLDKLLAVLGLIISLPLVILCAIIIKVTSKGPLFYMQTRLGLHGKPFSIIKLRTMRLDAEQDGAQQTSDKDKRIIPMGKIIRKLRIDEAPQFINVFKGEMSVVGPRPERPEFIEQYEKEIPFYRERLFVWPGITGWAQIHSGYAASSDQTREKLLYDLYYIKNVTFLTDLVILLKTVRIVLFGSGAK